MKKTLSLLLALTMVISLFAGLTVTASADYAGTGTFTKATGTLESGYYVFGKTEDSSLIPASGTASGNWIMPGDGLDVSDDSITDPDSSIVWYFDASLGTLSPASDPSLFLYYTGSKNTATLSATATPVYVQDNGDGVYTITMQNDSSRTLRFNSTGWRFYGSSTGNGSFAFFKLTDSSAPTHEHDWDNWLSNGDGTHSRTCLAQDCPIGTQTENCSYRDEVATEPTCVDEGELMHICTVCGYTRSEAIAPTGQHVDEDGDGLCDECGEEMPTATVFTLGTELHEGDQVVIYYPAGSLALSVNASGSKLSGTAASIEGEELTVMSNDTATAVMTVEFADATNFYLKTADGQYLTTGATGNSLSFAAEASDYALWYLEVADASAKTVYIRSTNAAYNGNKNQAMEYYSGFTVYGIKTNNSQYLFQLFILANPEAHVHDWDEGTVTTEPSCTSKGVKTFTCSGCEETYTEDIPMIPHADGDGDGLCDACEGKIYSQAETLNDGDSLILVTGAFGVALTGTETSNGGYMAAVEINAQEGVTVPVADDNVWTVKTAEGGFYLVNSEGQYLCVNESNKLALGDEDSDNILWTIGESVEGLEPTGAYLYNPGAERYLEYGKNYNNYQTYTAPTADYETWYAFTFYTIPVSRFTLSPTEVTLEGFDENGDLLLPFTAETLVFGTATSKGGYSFRPNALHIEFYSGALSNGTDSIPFQIYAGWFDEHWGTGESFGIDLSEQGGEESVRLFIEPSALSAAAPGVYTGTMRYTSMWFDDGDSEADGPSGTVELTLVVPEPAPLEDGYYLLIAHGEDDWVIDSVDPANKFETNPNDTSEWLLQTTLAAEDQIKVVRVENNGITGWWPDGEHTQYHVDEAHSGNVTIYFKTDYVDDWRDFGGYFYIGEALAPVNKVVGYSVTTTGTIGLNVYLELTDEMAAQEGVTIVANGVSFDPADVAVVSGDKTYYKVTANVAAKDAFTPITVQVLDENGNAVALYKSSGEEIGETLEISVADYLSWQAENSEDEVLLRLVKSMYNYCACAAYYFGSIEELPALYEGDDLNVDADLDLDIYMWHKNIAEDTQGFTYKGVSLLLKTDTTLRVYFSAKDLENAEVYLCQVGCDETDGEMVDDYGEPLTPVKSGSNYYVEITNISAKDLDEIKGFTIRVVDGENVTHPITVGNLSALGYAYAVQESSSDENLVRLVHALYWYNQAANEYFEG